MWFNFAVGLLILFRIFLFVYFIVVGGAYIHLDSGVYLDLAENLLNTHSFALSSATSDFEVQSVDVPHGPQVFRTPGYPVFLATLKYLGMESPYWIIFWQEIIYGLTIYIFYKYGRTLFGDTISKAGVIFLMLDPAGIAYPKLILSETLFLPFVFVGLLAIGLYLKHFNWRYLMISGALMGVGALIRPIIFYFPLVAATTIIFFRWQDRTRWLHASIILLSFTLVVSPWVIRNYQIFDQYMFSGQTSNMFTHYHLPKVWNAAGVQGYYEGQQHIRKMVAEKRSEREKHLDRPLNAVEFFKLQQKVALTELIRYPGTYFTQWVGGSLKAMYVPFAVQVYGVFHEQWAPMPLLELFPDTLQAEQTNIFGLSNSGVSGLFAKGLYFLTHANKLYLLSLILSVLNMLFACLGVISIIGKKDCFLWLMMLCNYYYIFIAGPMGYARFRMPIDVFWFIQALMGAEWFLHLLQQWNSKLRAQAYAA